MRKEDSMEDKQISDQIAAAVASRLREICRVDLAVAKRLTATIEQYCREQGLNAVIAVCNPKGNPIAVHVMDGAFLLSYDVAVKKAYTAAAVKMSTMELNALAQPGGTFYGIDRADGGRIVILGGGVPLKAGDRIVGALGISGGTAEQDDAAARYGAAALAQMWRESL